MYTNIIKPISDFVLGLFVFLILLPVFLCVMTLLFFNNGGKPFFCQLRPGKKSRLFMIIKFKTMTDKRDAFDNLLPDAERLTRFGSFVRKTSLDEIPQLINVIKGDMSLIGPRPLLPEYLALYSKEQLRRHDVRPGITGWAQVNGRNAIDWKQKFKLDLYYIDNLSFMLDLKIILLSIKKVLIKEGISSDTSVTMEKFTGN